jgi:carbon-monoxide dehydrogenase large subunit
MSILGNSVVRREDPAMLTTGATYVEDLDLPGVATVTFVRATMGHARLLEIDVAGARDAPGVLAVVTAAELGLPDHTPDRPLEARMTRPRLARDVVRFVGEPIVAIVAETAAQGVDAAEAVFVDYDPLPVVVDPEEAVHGEVLLYPELGTNTAMEMANRKGDLDLSSCEVVVEARIVNQRVAPAPLEGRAAAAHWVDDRLEMWVACQGAHPVRDALVTAYGLEPEQVRVVVPDVGGGFGAKADTYPEVAALGALSRIVGRPVRWVESRSESMVGLGHGRGQVQHVRMGGTRDGRITHYDLRVLQDAGAYPAIGAVLPYMTRTMLTGTYDIAESRFSATSVVTNTTPIVAYRGAGRPEATAAIERTVDLFAAEIGMDPVEVRRRNLVPDDAFPWKNGMGTEYDTGAYTTALDLALETVGYEELRAQQARRRAAGDTRALGIGVSSYVEITALGHEHEFGACELRADGTVVVTTGSTPYGQGHQTSWAMLVSDRLGVPMDRIEIRHGDTDLVPFGHTTGGSRSLQISGSAVWEAAGGLAELARERAADLLEAAVDDIVFDAGTADDGETSGAFHVAGVPARTVGWDDVAGLVDDENPLLATVDFSAEASTFPFGSHVSVVEVDLETGAVELLRHVAVDDAGTILNPLLVAGQVHGGLAQGIAQALHEQVLYDEDANPLTSNLADYGIPAASELPSFERVAMETPTFRNPLGAKGIGESGTIGSTPAVQNAVVDALAHLGVRHIDMPLTPERVWRAIPRGER